jgi:isoquinoline 1-oxidoreductase alpha subunit
LLVVQINVNGKLRQVDVPAEMPLLWALRDELGLVGTKFGCGVGLCGACTVHVNGEAVRSCQTPVGEVGTGKVTTIEAVGATPIGAKVQQAWIATDVMQCGYCQAGQIMQATALLAEKPKPTDAEIDDTMNGNLCRCACYTRIRTAIRMAAGMEGKRDAA